MTAAHKTLPFGTMLRINYRSETVVVRVNDRGPLVLEDLGGASAHGTIVDQSGRRQRLIGQKDVLRHRQRRHSRLIFWKIMPMPLSRASCGVRAAKFSP